MCIYTYNTKNQQTQVELEDGTVQTNRYDPEGLRHEMEENGKLLRFVYHKGELVYERGEKEQTSYHQGAGTEALNRAGKIYYYHKDEQLSTALITDETGTASNCYQYDAFGNILSSTEQIENRIRYTGQQYDGITGQYYLRARYYNPSVGRFIQEDTYRGDGLNLYAYCANNPVTYYDPSGYSRTSSYVAADGGDGGAGDNKSREVVLDTEPTHESARNKLLSELDKTGAFTNGSNPYMGRLESSYGYEKQIGRQSLDGKVRWRLDYDPELGVHYNIEDFSKGKGVNAGKEVIPIDISYDEYKSILDLWN